MLFELLWPSPQECYSCGSVVRKQGEFAPSLLCRQCRDRLRRGSIVRGPGFTGSFAFRSVRALGPYSGIAGELVRGLKYARHTHVVPYVASLLSRLTRGYARQPDTVVPVPLHTGRLQQRGFNQAALLGKQLAEKLSIPYGGRVLRRTKSTRPLVGLSAQERQQEVCDAFRMDKQSVVAGTRVLLIDDVFTTGSSTGACSRELLRGGAKTVDVMVVAYRTMYTGEKQSKQQEKESKVKMNGAKECTGAFWGQRCVRPQDELRTEVD